MLREPKDPQHKLKSQALPLPLPPLPKFNQNKGSAYGSTTELQGNKPQKTPKKGLIRCYAIELNRATILGVGHTPHRNAGNREGKNAGVGESQLG